MPSNEVALSTIDLWKSLLYMEGRGRQGCDRRRIEKMIDEIAGLPPPFFFLPSLLFLGIWSMRFACLIRGRNRRRLRALSIHGEASLAIFSVHVLSRCSRLSLSAVEPPFSLLHAYPGGHKERPLTTGTLLTLC